VAPSGLYARLCHAFLVYKVLRSSFFLTFVISFYVFKFKFLLDRIECRSHMQAIA